MVCSLRNQKNVDPTAETSMETTICKIVASPHIQKECGKKESERVKLVEIQLSRRSESRKRKRAK